MLQFLFDVIERTLLGSSSAIVRELGIAFAHGRHS